MWYYKTVGNSKCPIVDTFWQTETGGIMISPLAGITPNKPAHASLPLPGIQPIIVDAEGNELKGNNVEGNLCIKFPWPSILRTTYGDHKRFKETYFSTYPGMYFTGDGAKRDMRMAIIGSPAGSMMCSTFRATAWALPKSKAHLWHIPKSLRRRLSAIPMTSRDRAFTAM